MDSNKITVALAGNPNVGKTTMFNAITGARQHVGNWPGVTVEKKVGYKSYKGYDLEIVDLPGTYSLSAYSKDEVVARDYIVKEHPDVVIHIADATNLERNLYLLTQIMELDVRIVVALNMVDIARENGDVIDAEQLSRNFGVPVVETVGSKGTGVEDLLDAVLKESVKKYDPQEKAIYRDEIEEQIESVKQVLAHDTKLSGTYPLRWLSIKLLENDEEVVEHVSQSPGYGLIEQELALHDRDAFEMDIVDNRYMAIQCILDKSCRFAPPEMSASDMFDKVFTHKYLGIPIFLAMMWAAFELTFTVASPFSNAIDWIFTKLAELITTYVAHEQLASLLGDGIVGGLGSVLVFVPNIFILFLLISFLEDSGYLARAAFVMDRLMSRLGLHGKSFIPLLMGFGCSVPAIMACRSIENEKDRIITILSTPFISCGARLPVYVLFAGIFFSQWEGEVVFSLYVISIIIAIASAKLFRNTLFKGEKSSFIMELPPYRIPTLKTSLIHMWERGKLYLKKAGTIILLGVTIIWFLASFPSGVEYGAEGSIIAMIGKVIEPLVSPLGFDWKIAVALLFGFVAKEIVVGSLGTLYGAGENEELLSDQLQADPGVTALSSVGLMLFTLIYSPCIATVSVIKKETGSWKWMAFSIAYSTALAWVVAFLVHTVGVALGY